VKDRVREREREREREGERQRESRYLRDTNSDAGRNTNLDTYAQESVKR